MADKWVEDLLEHVEDMLADSKQIKFNTHKNRKAFTNTLKAVIKQAIEEHGGKSVINRDTASYITRPNPNPIPKGFAVMTEGESSKNDDVHRSMPQPPKPQVGVRSW